MSKFQPPDLWNNKFLLLKPLGLTKSPLPERNIANRSKLKAVTLCVCVCVCVCVCMCVCAYIYLCVIYSCVYMYIYIYLLCSAQSCLTLKPSIGCNLQGFSFHGISQARVQEQVAISHSRRSPQSRNKSTSLAFPALTSRFLHRKNKTLTQEK